MRTTVHLDEALLTDAKKYAAETGRTLTAIIEDALREVLARQRPPAKRSKVRFPVLRGGRLRPGVDLDHTSALLGLMEGHP